MPLINAVKELNNKIDKLEKQNKYQQSIIEDLKNKNRKIILFFFNWSKIKRKI